MFSLHHSGFLYMCFGFWREYSTCIRVALGTVTKARMAYESQISFTLDTICPWCVALPISAFCGHGAPCALVC